MAFQQLKKYAPLAIGIAAALLAFALFRGLIQAALAFVVAYLAARVIMFPRPSPGVRVINSGRSTDSLDLDGALREAKPKLEKLKNLAFSIVKTDARKRVDAICDVIGRILDDIKQDPKDLKAARQFLDYYLDATVKIVAYYVDLSAKSTGDPEVAGALTRVEGELDTIHAAFEKQLKMLQENDLLDLDTELTVLRKTIEYEGLGPDPGKTAGSGENK